MNNFKKILLNVLTVCLIVSCLSFSVSAVGRNERENNNDYSTANVIEPNESIGGNLSSDDDVDVFKIIAPSDGKLTIEFCHIYDDSGLGWDISIMHNYNGEYKEICSTSITLEDNEKISFPYIGAVANSESYIRISTRWNTFTSANYTINTSFETSNFFEKEFNDKYSTANIVTTGENICGNLSNIDDVDIFRFSIPLNGKLSVKFCHTYDDDGLGWDVSFVHYCNGEYKEISGKRITLEDIEEISFPNIGVTTDDKYYIKISTRWNTFTSANYSINASLCQWSQNANGQWMYIKDGVPQTGWVLDGAVWYYLGTDGIMKTGWINDGGANWYYLNGSGVMQTGWVLDGATWYYMNSSGVMQTGWQKIKYKWYYFNGSGAMQTGWVWDGGYWYYLGADGAMYTSCRTPDGYYVDSNGRCR